MRNDEIYCLIKFGQKEHIERLLNNGEVYFKPITYFRHSSESQRGDNYEGAFTLENIQVKEIKAEHPTLGIFFFHPVENSTSRLVNYNDDVYLSFSTYSISTKTFQNSNEHKINKAMLAFGDYAIMINDPLKFRKAIFKQLDRLNLPYWHGTVRYHNYSEKEKYNLSFFDKSEEYIHQEEYRIIIKSKDSHPLIVNIEAITDYSIVSSSQTMIETTWNANRNPRH